MPPLKLEKALMTEKTHGIRCAVLAGPLGAGKTTLLKAIMKRAGGDPPVVDGSPEAKEFGMTTEPNFARCSYLNEPWVFADCPGSIELFQTPLDLMRAADIVVIVAEPHEERAASLSPYFKFLDAHDIPHVLFINRVDEVDIRVRDTLRALQAYSQRPLVLRQIPIRDGGKIVGAVDVVSERAWKYREGDMSELVEIPDSARELETEVRGALLETLADFDDALMEQILEDRIPPTKDIFKLMAKELQEDAVVPVLLGSASHGNGVTRLLKLLRHETADVGAAAARNGFDKAGSNVASVVRTTHAPHIGKISTVRIWKGAIKDGDTIDGGRISGLLAIGGDIRQKQKEGRAGDLVGLQRFDALATGDLVIDGAIKKQQRNGAVLTPVFSRAVRSKNEKDDMKLSSALQKLADEDASLIAERRQDTGQLVLRGQGDIGLRLAAAKLRNQFNVEIETADPKSSFRETIKAAVDHHARHKKQSGGHGQFADIKVKIRPLPRGAGFQFEETIHGGSVPRQFIPAVEEGVEEGLRTGPLGFPVVDLAVNLYDGQHHDVDSNEMSFKTAGRQAMREGLPECDPVLLEPIYKTRIHTPSDHTNKMLSVVSSRRGQILGYDAREGWPGWDTVTTMMPEPGLADLIIEIRSLSQGAATFESQFDHYQELFGRDAQKIVEERKQELGRS
jgi:elongation factor G